MYQGSNKTALCSQKNIAGSFIELLREKEYSKISISEICQKAGVSRQTFYTLFESKENIVSFVLTKHHEFNPSEDCNCKGAPTLKQLSAGYSSYILSKKEILELLVKNNIIYMMQCNLYKAFTNCDEVTPVENPIMHDLTTDFVAAGLTTIAKHYCMHSDSISEESLQDLIYDLFSGKYFPED